LEARRFQEPSLSKKKAAAIASANAATPSSTSSSERNKGSADAEARRKAMIAAVDAREKAHKQKTKPTSKYVTKTTLLRQAESHVNNFTSEELKPQSEASRQAAVAAKRDEVNHANELGYNPYAAAKSSAGQARNATVTTQHGEISSGNGGGGSASIPVVVPPSNPTTPDVVDYPLPEEFEEALVTIVSSQDSSAAKTGLKIARTLITNATTKGQQPDTEAGAKFRKVRLENAKIKAAVVDVPGSIQLMLSVGFQLIECDENNESLLMFPPCHKEPEWLSTALRKMEQQEKLL
jgi:hypothetical protein